MTMWSYLFTFIIACSFREGLGAADFTDPSSGTLIANIEGAVNATTLTCNITNPEGNQITTQWNVANFRGSGPNNLRRVTEAPELFFVSGDPISSTDMRLLNNRLTILSWTTELDEVILYCGTGVMPQQANFTLRVYRPPNLRDNFLVMIVQSTENVPVDLRQDPVAFPEPNTTDSFTWKKDGQPLTGLAVTYSTVTFPTIRRTDAGNYTVFATNFAFGDSMQQIGNDTGSFYLDVLYGPSFQTMGPTQRYVLLNDSLSLVCGTGLDSNPQATITWTAPDSTTIMDNARYDLENGPDIVRLNFTHTIQSDSGVWICVATVRSETHFVRSSDGRLELGQEVVIGSPIQFEIQLTVIAPPGQPRTLAVENIGVTWLRICWDAPFDIESPISKYEVIARPIDNDNARLVNVSTTDNSTFFNITGLLPGTTYNLTVVAVSQGGGVIARGPESAPLGDIMTSVTVPELTCPKPVSEGGIITVTWSYVHTGGLPLTAVTVVYSFDQGSITPTTTVQVGRNDEMVEVPGLVAGRMYTFTVTAENINGSSSAECEAVKHSIGIPAMPMIRDLTSAEAGQVTVEIRTFASGVDNSVQGFQFVITPVLGGVTQDSRSFSQPNYENGQYVALTVDGLEQGSFYSFSATATNIFGSSDPVNSLQVLVDGPAPTEKPDSGSATGAIAGGVVAGIIVVIIAVVLVVLIVLLLVRRNREQSGDYKVEGGKYHKASASDPSSVNVHEVPGKVDIGDDLEKHPPREDTELQYADLESIRPPSHQKSGANNNTKPMEPEEPVEYALITGFKKSDEGVPTSPTAAAGDADKAGTSTTIV